jgi:hypothetical protein
MNLNSTSSANFADLTTPSNNNNNNNNNEINNVSLLYGIIALALFVFVLIFCTFLILCYFRCLAKAHLDQQHQQQLQNFALNESNAYNNEGFQLGSDTSSRIGTDEHTKPPVYDSILNYSPADKLPTYNSYKQAKDRYIIPTASSVLEGTIINDHPV